MGTPDTPILPRGRLALETIWWITGTKPHPQPQQYRESHRRPPWGQGWHQFWGHSPRQVSSARGTQPTQILPSEEPVKPGMHLLCPATAMFCVTTKSFKS